MAAPKTTTLDALIITVIVGLFITGVTFILFSLAVRARSSNIAPRCSARDGNTVFNPNATRKQKKELGHNCSNEEDDERNRECVQYRGGPMFGWIPWCMSLSYEQLLKGVPGTGTRKKGMEGSMLKVNLDGIVLLRFHAICLRMAILGTFLGLCIVLPINLTADCSQNNDGTTICDGFANDKNLTNFEVTTIENIPILLDQNNTDGGSSFYFVMDLQRPSLWRFYAIVLVSWAMIFYCHRLLKKEWVDALALRRIYYLEGNHWQNRTVELKKGSLESMILRKRRFQRKEKDSNGKTRSNMVDNRPPFIPHPEQRDTVPNIELYSVLVGEIPTLPSKIASNDDAMGEIKSSLDWQLKVTTSFFDQCVPNQPGFSSSVAAVTILPDASKLALTWKKWYKFSAVLRRLRFVREVIAERLEFIKKCKRNFQDDTNNESDQQSNNCCSNTENENSLGRQGLDPAVSSQEEVQKCNVPSDPSDRLKDDSVEIQNRIIDIFGVEFSDFSDGSVEKEVLHKMVHFYGPEQTAVHAIEFARSAICCPNGCNEENLYHNSLPILEDLNDELSRDVVKSFKELVGTQTHVNVDSKRPCDIEMQRANTLKDTSRASMYHNHNSNLLPTENQKADEQHNLIDDNNQNTDSNELLSCSSFGKLFELEKSNRDSLPPQRTLTLTNQGKVYFKDCTQGEQEHSYKSPFVSPQEPVIDYQERSISPWQKVEHAVNDGNSAPIHSGAWNIPSLEDLSFWKMLKLPFKKTIEKVDEIQSMSTFAIVTFTSRQAAVAARHCLADGTGAGAWIPVEEIPVPPLADSAVYDFRSCGKPVTLTLNPKRQHFRNFTMKVMVTFLYLFWGLPLVSVFRIEILDMLQNFAILGKVISGNLTAMFTSLFFAICPTIFRALSDFGSNAVTLDKAEFIALQLYWWFMLISGFFGATFTSMAYSFFFVERNNENIVTDTLAAMSEILPRQSGIWLNWIIFRTLLTLPLAHMLNAMAFVWQRFHWLNFFARSLVGGGPGGAIDYSIYVESGIVLICVVGLTPISPLLAPAALGHFLFCTPLWRRNLIYKYRPNFDSGGSRWPFLADIFYSVMLISQILLSTTMLLRRALGPAILSILVLIPVYLHRRATRKKYLRAYKDAALLQTSQLDGWDNTLPTSKELREEYRKFLVDAHRAAYVPICLVADNAKKSTYEPAVVVPHHNDMLEPFPNKTSIHYSDEDINKIEEEENKTSFSNTSFHGFESDLDCSRCQQGASLRRVIHFQNNSMSSLRRRGKN